MSHTPIGKRNVQNGLSLLEVMFAMMLMSMIALVLASVMGNISRTLARTGTMSRIVEVVAARQDLRNWLEAAVPGIPAADGGDIFGLDGGPHGLAFRTILDDGQFWPGAAATVKLAVEGTGRVRVTVEGLEAGSHTPTKRSVLLTMTGGQVEIAYYGQQASNEQLGWHASWRSRTRLPRLIRILLSDKDRTYPPLDIFPAKVYLQSEMSLSSLVPPARPSRP